MRKFFGGVLVLIASLSLVVGYDLWTAQRIVSPDGADDLAAEVLASPDARSAVGLEMFQRVQAEPSRVEVLRQAFGQDWRDVSKEIADRAVQTPEFEVGFLKAVEDAKEVAFADGSTVTIDIGPAILAVAPEFSAEQEAAIRLLPPDLYVLTDDVVVEEARWALDARQNVRVAALAAGALVIISSVGAVMLYQSIGPLITTFAFAAMAAVVQLLAVGAIRNEVLDDPATSALDQIAAEFTLDRLRRAAVILVVITVVPVVLSVVYNLIKHFTGGSDSSSNQAGRARYDGDQIESGSDTDWADSPMQSGFPRIID